MARTVQSDAQFHVNETARAARAAHARMMRGDLVTLHVYFKPMRIEAFGEDEVPANEGWQRAWPEAVPSDRTADALVAWFAARTGSVPYLNRPVPIRKER